MINLQTKLEKQKQKPDETKTQQKHNNHGIVTTKAKQKHTKNLTLYTANHNIQQEQM